MPWLDKYPEYKKFYEKAQMAGKMGYGERPAIVVVDMAQGWCDPASPMGADFTEVIGQIKRVLDVGRQISPKIPIIFTVMAYDPDFQELPETWRKRMLDLRQQVYGSHWVEIIPELERRKDEPLLVKKFASCFSATPLESWLISAKVDTLIITGCSTSACVHETCYDAGWLGFHPIVPEEAVGDRDPSLVVPFLVNMAVRWGEVEPIDEVLEYLKRIANRGSST